MQSLKSITTIKKLGGKNVLPLPALSSRTLSIPMDGSFAGTHSRLSNAWNPETGQVAPHNLALWSEDFSNAAWSAFTPSGSSTASTITFTGAGNDFRLQSVAGILSGDIVVLSLEMKAGSKTAINCAMSGIPNNNSYEVFNLTSDWAQYSFLSLTSGPGTLNIGFDNRVAQGGDGIAGTIQARKIQLNRFSLTSYVPATTAAVYSPRYVSGKTGQAMLIEEASSNLCRQNEDLAAAVWTADGITVTPNQIAPNGELTAALVTLTATTNRHRLYNGGYAISYTATPYSTSYYVKPGTATWFCVFDYGTAYANFNAVGAGSVGSTLGITGSKIEAIGGGWYRISINNTGAGGSTSAGINIAIGTSDTSLGSPTRSWLATGAETAYLWRPQQENLPYATSPIVSGATMPVTRAADVVTYPTAGVLTGTVGTVSLWFKPYQSNKSAMPLIGVNGGGQILAYFASNLNTLYAEDGTTTRVFYTSVGGVAGEWMNVIIAYDGTSIRTSVNGGTPIATVWDGDWNTTTTFGIAQFQNGTTQANAAVDNVNVWSVKLTDAQMLQAYRSGR